MRPFACLIAAAALAGLAAAGAQAKLSPAEQKWATPLIAAWNVQNEGLQKVIKQASAKNALIAGEKPQNLALTETLSALVTCVSPKNVVKAAGKPPTVRLVAFKNQLMSACADDFYGANYFAKAIGAVHEGNDSAVQTDLAKGLAKFKAGSAALTKAYHTLIALGGNNIFGA